MLLATERWESAAESVCSEKTMGGQRDDASTATTQEKVRIILSARCMLAAIALIKPNLSHNAHLSVNKRRFKDTFTRARLINCVYVFEIRVDGRRSHSQKLSRWRDPHTHTQLCATWLCAETSRWNSSPTEPHNEQTH
jgi:hypothetical protein